MNIPVDTTVEVGGLNYTVSFFANKVTIGNDGIGAYEFWGHRGVDKGQDFVEDYEVIDLEAWLDDIIGDRKFYVLIENPSLLRRIRDALEDSDEVRERIWGIIDTPPEDQEYD